MTDAIVCDAHLMNMDVGELEKAFDALPDYPQKDFDFRLTVLIAEYANSKGVAFPGMGVLAERLHCFKMDAKRGVDRVLKFSVFTVKKVKSEGARWEHNVYTFAKRFLRKTVDKLASHFDAQKWKTWVEEKLSERARKKLIRRYCEQADLDLENAGLRDGWWMAMRYVKKHVGETPGEYETILAEAIEKYRDYEGPNCLEIEDRPAEPVPVPVQEKPMEPVRDVNEEDQAAMFKVFDQHPELVNDPEKAAEMAGVVLPDMKPADPVPEPVSEADTPIEWEDGSQWPIEPLGQDSAPMPAPIQPAESVQTVKRETDLNTLPTNTTTPAPLPANTQSGPIQLDMTNCPKFINGEPSALWVSQQVLARMDPTQYPAY